MNSESKSGYMDEVIQAFRSACRAWLVGRLKTVVPPPVLYHFTDASGLAGILGNRILHASLVTSLNDSSEFQFGLGIAEDVISRRIKSKPSAFLQAALDRLRDPAMSAKFQLEMIPFVVSFCGEDNKSIHWSHYGQSGKGAAIAFDSALIAPAPLRLVQVEYARQRQEDLIDELLVLIESVANTFDGDDGGLSSGVGGRFFSSCMRLLSTELKDECFRDEEEWRLLAYERREEKTSPKSTGEKFNQTKYREVLGRIVPYIEIDLTPDLLT